jgi:hypothetical protein
MANGRREHQISVTLDPELRAALARAAEQEHRTVAAQLRHFAASALEARARHRDRPPAEERASA